MYRMAPESDNPEEIFKQASADLIQLFAELSKMADLDKLLGHLHVSIRVQNKSQSTGDVELRVSRLPYYWVKISGDNLIQNGWSQVTIEELLEVTNWGPPGVRY